MWLGLNVISTRPVLNETSFQRIPLVLDFDTKTISDGLCNCKLQLINSGGKQLRMRLRFIETHNYYVISMNISS